MRGQNPAGVFEVRVYVMLDRQKIQILRQKVPLKHTKKSWQINSNQIFFNSEITYGLCSHFSVRILVKSERTLGFFLPFLGALSS